MGRKIPGRKHHGVKDPEKQRQVRLEKIKDKINAPPKNPEEQHIPKSLSRIVEWKNKIKSGEFFRKKPKKETNFKFKDEKPIPKFEQYPNETDRAFLNRVNKICDSVKREAAFENKYRVDIKRDEKGEVSVVKRPKDELEMMIKKIKKDKKSKKKNKKKGDDEGPKLTKSQKWSLKKAEKKKKAKNGENFKDFESMKDNVKFGEIVHAPPSLNLPKKAQNVPRPGTKPLLLKSLLSKKEQNSKVIDKKGKRKNLPHSLRRTLETQQKEVIAAYKQLKIKKYEQNKR